MLEDIGEDDLFIKEIVSKIAMLYLHVVYCIVQRLLVINKLSIVKREQVPELWVDSNDGVTSECGDIVFTVEVQEEEAVDIFVPSDWNFLYGTFCYAARYVYNFYHY